MKYKVLLPLLILETLSIYFYMTGSLLGLISFLSNCVIVLFSKQSKIYKTIVLLIISLPFSFIGIGGIEMNHVLSWYNIFLIVFVMYTNRYLMIKTSAGISLVVVFLCLLIATLWASDTVKAFIEITQIMVMLVPTVFVYCSRRRIPLDNNQLENLFSIYGHIVFCAAIGMIIQYYYVFLRGVEIGMFAITGGGRISCNVLFRGASILPIFLGSGFVSLFLHSFSNKSYYVYSEILIIFAAMILNTSRTGIFALFCVIGYLMIVRIRKKISYKTLFLAIVMLIGAYIGMDYIMSVRSGLSSFTDDNGREVTYINGINIWLYSTRNFFFGEGFTGGLWDGITKTHNFVIQTLAQNGIIVATIIICFIFVFIKSIQKSSYKYIAWYILISCMLVTDIYANAFTSVVFILTSLHSVHSNHTLSKVQSTKYLKSRKLSILTSCV